MSETFKVGAQPNQGSTRRLEDILNQAQQFQQEHPAPSSEEAPEEPQEAADSPEAETPDASYSEQNEGDSEAVSGDDPAEGEPVEPEPPEEPEPFVVRVNGQLLQIHEPTWERLIALVEPIQRLFDVAKKTVGPKADVRDALSLALKSWEQPMLCAEVARVTAECVDIMLEKPVGWTAKNAKASEMSMVLMACLKSIPFDDLTQIANLANEVK